MTDLHKRYTLQLSRSISADKIRGHKSSFVSADYHAFTSIINEYISKPIVSGTDFPFLKLSGVTDIMIDELIFPVGMKSSIRDLLFCYITVIPIAYQRRDIIN